jgi:tRNA (guanine-N7-)-methyltransferase
VADDDLPPPWARPPGDGRPVIRTIGPQRGRLLPGHATAIDRFWDRYVVPVEAAAARSDGAVLDAAMGDGATTVALAAAAPEVLHLAVDVHRPGIAQLLRSLDEGGLENVVVVEGDVWDLLPLLPDGALAAVQCCFPDPWPKRRHQRRRLVTPRWVAEVARVLAVGGELRLATDWPDYAEQMRAAVQGCPSLTFLAGNDGWSPRFDGRPVTTYERRGAAAGRPPRDIRAVRAG